MNQRAAEGRIVYFEEEGRHNLDDTVCLVKAHALEHNIGKVVVFTADGKGALKVCEELEGTALSVIVTSVSPAAPPEGTASKAGTFGILTDVRSALKLRGVPLVEGNLPFEDIVIPAAFDRVLLAVRYTLACLSGGFPLCVQAVLMACDAGYVEPGETVIAMAADTAIVVRASRKNWMFAPFGLEIREIICKPRNLTITRKSFYEADKTAGQPVPAGQAADKPSLKTERPTGSEAS